MVSQDEETAALACEGFRRALGFMLARGYQPKSKLTIIAADRFPDRYREMVGDLIDNMHGFYDTDTREVYMKSLRWFMESEAERTPLGVGPSRELYVSYFAHEAGHHLSVQAFAKAPQLIARPHGEFISYALQLETMAEGLKNNLFKRFEAAGGGAFSSVESINGFAHDADPQSFAVKSYLFLKGPEGEKTLQGFMDAKIEPPAGDPLRATDDVDCVIAITSRVAFAQLEEKLRSLGFTHPMDDPKAPICRWRFSGILVDVMPIDAGVLGFSNRWYPEGVEHAEKRNLPDGQEVSIFTLP